MRIPKYFIYRVRIENKGSGDVLTVQPITREEFAAAEGLVAVDSAKWVVCSDGVYCSRCESFFFNVEGAEIVREFDYCPACGVHVEGEIMEV